jgi:hypothetical protein
MNVNLMRLKPVIRELRAIRLELQRMNDIKELELAYTGIHIRPPVADTSGADPVTLYTDEERDYFTELAEQIGKVGKQAEE